MLNENEGGQSMAYWKEVGSKWWKKVRWVRVRYVEVKWGQVVKRKWDGQGVFCAEVSWGQGIQRKWGGSRCGVWKWSEPGCWTGVKWGRVWYVQVQGDQDFEWEWAGVRVCSVQKWGGAGCFLCGSKVKQGVEWKWGGAGGVLKEIEAG